MPVVSRSTVTAIFGHRIVAEGPDQIADAIDAARDLADGGVLDLAIGSRNAFFTCSTTISAWASLTAKISVLPGRFGSIWRASSSATVRLKGDGDDLLVEILNLELDFVRQRERDRSSPVAVSISSTSSPFLKLIPALRQGRRDLERRIMVDQIAVDHGFAVGVGEDGVAEDIDRVQRRRRREADLHRIEILQDAAVFGDVVILAAEAEFGIRHLAVKQIAAVAFVDDHQIVLIDRRCV